MFSKYKNIYYIFSLYLKNKNVFIDPKYYRPCEVELLLGDASKAEEKLGWEREYDTLDKLIADMFKTSY